MKFLKKSIFILLAWVVGFAVQAQTVSNTAALRQKLDSVFQYIDKNQLPTGLLKEYAYPFVDLGKVHDSVPLNIHDFRATYATLQTARIRGQQTLPALQGLNGSIEADFYEGNTIVIPILHYQYNSIDPQALTLGLFRAVGEQLYDMPRSRSPYQSHIVTAAASSQVFNYLPIRHSKLYPHAGDTLRFSTSTNHYYSNLPQPDSLQIDFDDKQGFRTFSLQQWQEHQVVYKTGGKKYIKLRIYRAGIVYNSTLLYEIIDQRPPTSVVASRYTAQRAYEVEFDRNNNAATAHSGAKVTICLSQNNPTVALPQADRRFRRPLIVLKGFDPTDASTFRNLSLLGKHYDYETFIRSISQDVFLPFNDNLDDNNYDLIFVNYNNGIDDIRRNARLLQEVIRYVNARKAVGAEDAVVLGISMGGLVGRYGVAQMVRQFRATGNAADNPQVRLVLSHDSPHQGANTALGIQFVMRELWEVSFENVGAMGAIPLLLADIFTPIGDYHRLSSAASADQLLLYRMKKDILGTHYIQYNDWVINEYRNMVTFDAGNPAPYRFVATSNGSTCGNINEINTPLLKVEAGFFVNAYIAGVGMRYGITANKLPNVPTRGYEIGNFGLTAKVSFLGFDIERNLRGGNWKMHGGEHTLPVDDAAGGTQTTQFGNNNLHDGLNLGIVGANFAFQSQPRFCFIPRFSALDIIEPVTLATMNVRYAPNIVPAQARAENFTAGLAQGNFFSEAHISFTGRNTEFMFRVMQNLPTPEDCNSFCNAFTGSIVGSNNICNNPEDYSVVASQPIAVNWFVTDPLNLVTFTVINPTTIRITRNPNSLIGGFITLNANMVVGLCTLPVLPSKRIWVGEMSPITTINNNPLFDGCLTFQETFSLLANEAQGATSIRWFVTRNGGNETEVTRAANQRSWNTAIRVMPGTTEIIMVRVVADNGCSQSSYTDIFEYSLPAGRPRCDAPVGGRTIEPLLKLYPNPTAFLLNITIENLNSPIEQVLIRNGIGTVVLQTNSLKFTDDKTAVLSLDTLPEGIYFLTVTLQDGQQLSQKVVVQRNGVAN